MRILFALLACSATCLAAPEIPNPLKRANGTVITTKQEWENSLRAETLQLFRENVYGVTPIGRPVDFKSTVVREVPDALDGKATFKEIEITYSGPNGSGKIHPVVILPNAAKTPVGAFVLINNRKPDLLDISKPNEFFPVLEIINRGYAAVAFQNSEVDPDKVDGFKNGVRAIFGEQPPAANAWGSIAAWAWGASRVMDHLETESRIDPKRIAIIGHSRGGKAALWAGAEDPRFTLVISNDSGCGGAAITRIKDGEHIADINKTFPYWFCENYKIYNGKETELPVDQHQLIALIAPRLVCVGSAIDDKWADPSAEFQACVQAAPVYALYGLETVKSQTFPEVGKSLEDGHIAYHVRAGGHNLTLEDWNHYFDFADAKWKK